MKYISLIIISLLLYSCSGSRHAVKTSQQTDQKVDVTTEQVKTIQDNSTTVIQETVDDTARIGPVKIEAESPGMNVTAIVDGDTIKAKYDAKTNTIKTMYSGAQKKVPVKKNKTTTIRNDVQQEEVTKVDSSGRTRTEASGKNVTTKTSWPWWWVLVGVGIAVVGWLVWKKYGGVVRAMLK